MIKYYKILFVLIALMLMTSCATGPKVEPGSGSPPVIDEYFASPTANYSGNWKIFIKAHDPDGDMWRVQFKMVQPFFVYSDPEGYVFVPERLKKEMDGYFYMRPPSRRMRETSVDLTVYVTIMDQARNKSETIKLPLSFGVRKKTAPDPAGYRDDALLPVPYRIKTNNRIF